MHRPASRRAPNVNDAWRGDCCGFSGRCGTTLSIGTEILL